MRKLKFRAWDKNLNRFFKPVYEAYKGNLEDLNITFSGELLRRTLDINPEHESVFPDRYILTQDTGAKDANGKRIFDGDIVKIEIKEDSNDNSPEKIFIGKIVFYKKSLSYVAENKDGSTWHGWENRNVEIEIIGNKFENSELLK